MRALVTGHNGFIGGHLFGRLKSDARIASLVGVSRSCISDVNEEVFNDDGSFGFNIESEAAVEWLMKKYKPDVVFHFAANPLIKADESNPTEITSTNVLATHALLAHCPEGCRFILASSAAVYDDQSLMSGAEEHSLPKPSSIYGATKVAAEALVQAYAAQGRVRPLLLRFVANVGLGATHGVLPDMLRKLKSDSKELDLLGEYPGSCKPYIHVSDTVEAVIQLGLNPDVKGIFNICNDNPISIDSLAFFVMKEMGIEKKIKWGGACSNWKGDNPYVLVNNRKAKAFGWQPTYRSAVDAIIKATRESI